MWPPQSTRDENRAFLFDRFVEKLLAESPTSVLDVGCGRGGLLRRCSASGILAVGLEEETERVESAGKAGLDVRAGRGERLPFADGEFEWVAMRHVPHHLADPLAALGEALRVASVGVFLAEPWYDRALPSQDCGWCIDQWLRADDRRRGMLHGAGFSAADLADLLLRHRADLRIELETALRPVVEDLDVLTADIDHRRQDLPADHAAVLEIAALIKRAAETGAGLGGSAFVLARL